MAKGSSDNALCYEIPLLYISYHTRQPRLYDTARTAYFPYLLERPRAVLDADGGKKDVEEKAIGKVRSRRTNTMWIWLSDPAGHLVLNLTRVCIYIWSTCPGLVTDDVGLRSDVLRQLETCQNVPELSSA